MPVPPERAAIALALGETSTAATTTGVFARRAFGLAAWLALDLRRIFFAVTARDAFQTLDLARLRELGAATAHEVGRDAAYFGDDGIRAVGPFLERDFHGVTLVGVVAIDAVGGVGAERVAQGVGAATGVNLRLNRRLLVALGCEVAVKTVGEPVGRAVEVDDDRRENRTLRHLVGVALDSIVGGLKARLRAAVDVDRFEGKFLVLH